MLVRVVLICLLLGVAPNLSSVSQDILNRRIRTAFKSLEKIIHSQEHCVPRELIEQSEAIIILREYKGGFIFGASFGKGVVLVKDSSTGSWGAPGFIESYQGSCGLQVGGSSTDSILLLMNKSAVESLSAAKFRLGGELSVVAGPRGDDFNGTVSPDVSVITYTQSKGLFAGLTLGGGYFERDIEANHQYYGKDSSFDEITANPQLSVSPQAKELIRLLEDYVADAAN